jgi:Arabinose efflux permease
MSPPLGTILRSVIRQPGYPGVLSANFALGMASSFVVPFLSMWGTLHVGMSPVMFGTFMTITSVSAIVLSTLLARWSDSHVPRRTMLVIGSLCGMLGYAGYAFLTDVIALILCGSLLVGTATVNFSQLFAFVREELARPENQHADMPLLMSLLRVFFSLAWTVGPAIGAWVTVQWGYRGIFLGAVSLYAIFLLLVLRFVPRRPHPPVPHDRNRPGLIQVLARKDVVSTFTALVLVFAAFSMNMMNLPLLVTQSLGGTKADVGWIFSIAPVFEVPLMVWFGQLAARGHQVGLIRFGVVVSAVYFAALTLAQTPWHIYPMQILSAIAIAVMTNITITFLQDMLPGHTGLATTLYSNSFSGGSLVGFLSFGLLLERVGYRGVFVICVILCSASLALLLVARHRAPLRAVG